MMRFSRTVLFRAGRSFSNAVGGEAGIADRAEQSKGAMKEFMKSVSPPSGGNNTPKGVGGVWNKLMKENNTQGKLKGNAPSNSQDKSKDNKPRVYNKNNNNNNNQRPATPRPNNNNNTNNRPNNIASRSSTPKVQGGEKSNAKKTAPRVFNNRPGGAKKGGKSADGALFTAMGGERGKTRRNRDENEEDKKASWDKIPDAIQPLLFDHEYFAKKASEANRIIDSKMDPLDTFLAEAFMGAFKTNDSTYQTFIESGKGKGLQLPQARSMTQLQHSMLPRIETAQKGTSAYAVAESAWGVIQQNYYYNDRQKADMVNGIAAKMLLLQQRLDSSISDSDGTLDMIFDPTFRKGIPGIEKENREKLLSQNVVKIEDGSDKGETNWDVAAVEDEDQL